MSQHFILWPRKKNIKWFVATNTAAEGAEVRD